MKQPGRRRRCANPGDVTLPAPPIYIGSPEHKDHVTREWRSPRPRADASICPVLPPHVVSHWLARAVANGDFSELREGGFPRYAWYRDGGQFYEARLTNQVKGEYKG